MKSWLALLLLTALPAQAAELAMFDRADCPSCARWTREIGPIYPKTPEARDAPLHRYEIRSDIRATLTEPVTFTPTFVLIDRGHEIGRIVGYNNNESFWMQLSVLMAKLPTQ